MYLYMSLIITLYRDFSIPTADFHLNEGDKAWHVLTRMAADTLVHFQYEPRMQGRETQAVDSMLILPAFGYGHAINTKPRTSKSWPVLSRR